MTSEEFVARMYESAVNQGVDSSIACLRQPPGRKPHRADVEDSEWFNRIDESDKEFVRRCMVKAAEMALFSVFTVLDGVSFIEGIGSKGEFKLYFEKDGAKTLLNAPDGEMLHDLMPQNSLWRKATADPSAALRFGRDDSLWGGKVRSGIWKRMSPQMILSAGAQN